MKKPKALVLLSGGMDSLTLLHYVIEKLNYPVQDVSCVGFNYGQKHIKELDYAEDICRYMGVEFIPICVDLNGFGQSALTSDIEVPKAKDDKQIQTVVPGRNAVMLSLAVAKAMTIGVDSVFFAPTLDDFKSYPDCRSEFVTSICQAMTVGYAVRVYAPLINLSKSEIVKLGIDMKVHYELAWSCYKGEEEPCMECDACVERINAMKANGRNYYGTKQ